MNKNLGSLLASVMALPDDEVSKPTESDIAILENIDQGVDVPRCELEELVESTRLKIKARGSSLLGMQTFVRLGYGVLPDIHIVLSDIDALRAEHCRRVKLILGLLYYGCNDGIQESEAGIKPVASLVRRIEQVESGRPDHIPDVSRIRIVCRDLKALETAQKLVEKNLPKQGLLQVTRKNRYGDREGRIEDSNGQLIRTDRFGLIDPYRAISSGWVSGKTNALVRTPTELMFATKRATACSRLNQPYRILSQRLHWPDEEAMDWMLALMHKANILDYRDYLADSLK